MAEGRKKPPKQRRTRITATKKALKKVELVEALTQHMGYEWAAAQVGLDRRVLYEWRKEDPEFDAACEQARTQAVDRLIGKTFEVGLNENGRYFEKDALLNRFFLIKGYRPEFKDSYRPEVAVREVTFTFNIPGSERLLRSANPELPEHVIEGEVIEAG